MIGDLVRAGVVVGLDAPSVTGAADEVDVGLGAAGGIDGSRQLVIAPRGEAGQLVSQLVPVGQPYLAVVVQTAVGLHGRVAGRAGIRGLRGLAVLQRAQIAEREAAAWRALAGQLQRLGPDADDAPSPCPK